MPYAQAREIDTLVNIPSPSGLGAYVQDMSLGQVEEYVRGPSTDSAYVVSFYSGTYCDVDHLRVLSAIAALRLAKANAKWRRHVFDAKASSDVDTLTETVEAGLDFISQYGPAALSFVGLSATAVQCEHLAALLRATSTWRDKIQNWDDALSVAKSAAILAKCDPSDVLFGMV